MTEIDDTFANQVMELRRGTIVLAILSTLQQPRYGYALLKALVHVGFIVEAGTLYPLLRRLEKQGVLESEWNTDDVRPRKYYRLSGNGEELYIKLRTEWLEIQATINKMIGKDQ